MALAPPYLTTFGMGVRSMYRAADGFDLCPTDWTQSFTYDGSSNLITATSKISTSKSYVQTHTYAGNLLTALTQWCPIYTPGGAPTALGIVGNAPVLVQQTSIAPAAGAVAGAGVQLNALQYGASPFTAALSGLGIAPTAAIAVTPGAAQLLVPGFAGVRAP